jgi:hypothetical protein
VGFVVRNLKKLLSEASGSERKRTIRLECPLTNLGERARLGASLGERARPGRRVRRPAEHSFPLRDILSFVIKICVILFEI